MQNWELWLTLAMLHLDTGNTLSTCWLQMSFCHSTRSHQRPQHCLKLSIIPSNYNNIFPVGSCWFIECSLKRVAFIYQNLKLTQHTFDNTKIWQSNELIKIPKSAYLNGILWLFSSMGKCSVLDRIWSKAFSERQHPSVHRSGNGQPINGPMLLKLWQYTSRL